MDFKEKFEPRGNYVLHGAGQSPIQFKKYWDVMGNRKPLIYMEYIKFNEVKEKLIEKLKKMKNISGNLCLQLGLNLKPRNDVEKSKEISEGLYDEDLLFLINELKKLKNPVFLRIGYECNDPAHNYDPKGYVASWKHIVTLFRKENANNVAFVWNCCTAFTRDINELMKYYPGDKYVNWFSDDLFGVKHFIEKNNPKIITQKFLDEALKHKKPVMIGESTPAKIGVNMGEKSWNEWFKPYFKWIGSHPIIKAFCYINWDWGKDWKQPEWLNGRIEENEEVMKKYLEEMSKKKYFHSMKIKDFLDKVY